MPDVGGIAGDRLRSFIERIERLEEEKRSLNQDIKEVYAEAKGNGFDTKIMRLIVKERRLDKDDLDEQQTLDLTRRALPDDPRPRPWAIFREGKETLYLPVLEAARNYADKAYPVGFVEIENIDTGEQWKRRAGEWSRARMAQQAELGL